MRIALASLVVVAVGVGCGSAPLSPPADYWKAELPLDGTESLPHTALPHSVLPYSTSTTVTGGPGPDCPPFSGPTPPLDTFVGIDTSGGDIASPVSIGDLVVSATGADVKGSESGQLSATRANVTVWATRAHNALPERIMRGPGVVLSAWHNSWLHHELFNNNWMYRWYALGVDAATGTELWVAGPIYNGQLVAVDDTTAVIYSGRPTWPPAGVLYALDPLSGSLRWNENVCEVESLALVGGVVYAHHVPDRYETTPSVTYAYDERDGASITQPSDGY